MEFEFDVNKSKQNKDKHGIDFIEAKKLWDDPMFLEVPARTENEKRYFVIGMLDDRCWSALITYRGKTIRIISVRRSRKNEEELYKL
ncbi:MAG: BrnT family toxin [Bacteroidales bacterium]|nr:BrnT family toxin [Bacteroidales bacterium]